MNQRSRRDGKADYVSVATGGNNTLHRPGQDPIVQVPSKATGEIKNDEPKGIAKASPNFKPIEPKSPENKEDEKKAIANNTKPVTE